MGMNNIGSPASIGNSESRLRISDDYLNNQTDLIDLVKRTPAAAFVNTVEFPCLAPNGHFNPRYISIDGDNGGAQGALDITATEATVNMRLQGEAEQLPQTIASHVLHGMKVRAIDPTNTTARGICIHQ